MRRTKSATFLENQNQTTPRPNFGIDNNDCNHVQNIVQLNFQAFLNPQKNYDSHIDVSRHTKTRPLVKTIACGIGINSLLGFAPLYPTYIDCLYLFSLPFTGEIFSFSSNHLCTN
ncbi:MAG: hypothetical protein HC836_37560 [Richelia sp. RM2_1_2]|nr:hypothetical protein [Richelia sp. RM1_1_1]NJO30144.1 hypothetical protein [Richelia sp. SL_2_1]NJO63694.1 hypothetical protein [Richelia sp. RM2_1_2]